MRASAKVFVLSIVMVLAAAGCSTAGVQEDANQGDGGAPVRGGTYSLWNGEPEHLIPQNCYDTAGAQVFQALWTRLVKYDPETSEPILDQAESIDVSDDGLTYTIKIKPGWTFHNGEPVTAQSYVDAWNYAAYGPNGYILNFFFDPIQGYDDLNPKKGEPTAEEMSGLQVVDDTTFTVTLQQPHSQFMSQLGFDAFDPLPQVFYDDPKAFDEKPIGDGPYMMDGKWQHDETINLMRYEDYAGEPGYADKIELRIYHSTDAGYLDFQGGNLDVTTVYSDFLNEARQNYSDVLNEGPGANLLFLTYPLYQERFQNVALRQALSMAVDREAVMNAILMAEKPADDFAPPAVAGYRQDICEYCRYDPEAAKQKLEEAGGWEGELPLQFPGDDITLEQAMEAVANQWEDNLGIQVKLSPVDPNSMWLDARNHKMKGPFWDGWWQDYPSLQDFLEPLYGEIGSANNAGYSNPEFDALLVKGNSATDPDEAMSYYQQADDILLNDMPAIPWGYLGFNTVHSERVTNVLQVPALDMVALEKVQVVGAGSPGGTQSPSASAS